MTTPNQPRTMYYTPMGAVPTQNQSVTTYLNQTFIPKLIVEVFHDPFFGGHKGTIIDNVPDTGMIGFRYNISSARIYKGPGFATSPNYKAIFHEERDYKGRQLILGPGYYPSLHWIGYDFGDVISSVSFGPTMTLSGPIYGTVPLIVEVYRDVDFKGKKVTVLRDINHTNKIDLHDAISSIKIYRGPDFPPTGCKAVFYEHIEYDGKALEIELGPLEYHKEIPNLYTHPQYFGALISSIKISSWMSGGSGKFKDVIFLDEFDTIKPIWRWIDPRNDCARQIGQPKSGGILQERKGWLELHVGQNHDLWWGPNGQGGNMDAPRMVQPISGNFAIEAKITCLGQQREHGGLLVWKDDNRFVRLEKTSALHAFKGDIRFETHVRRLLRTVGRGQQNSVVNYIRLERSGHEFTGYCSTDGQDWQLVGSDSVIMQDPVMVGVHALCPGNTPSTVTRFDYFKIMKPTFATNTGWASNLYSYGTSVATTSVSRLAQTTSPAGLFNAAGGQGKISVSNMPRVVRDVIRREMGGRAPALDIQWAIDNGRIIYRVEVEGDDRSFIFTIAEDGTLIDRTY